MNSPATIPATCHGERDGRCTRRARRPWTTSLSAGTRTTGADHSVDDSRTHGQRAGRRTPWGNTSSTVTSSPKSLSPSARRAYVAGGRFERLPGSRGQRRLPVPPRARPARAEHRRRRGAHLGPEARSVRGQVAARRRALRCRPRLRPEPVRACKAIITMSVQQRPGWARDPIHAAGRRRHYNSVRQFRVELRRIEIICFLVAP